MSHPTLAEIVSYVGGRMAEQEAFHLETHLSRCPDCATRVRTHRVFRDNRASLFARPARVIAAESVIRKRICALAIDPALPAEVRQRLRRWSRSILASTRAALRIGIESAAQRAWILSAGYPVGSAGSMQLEFAPVVQPARVRGRGASAPAMVESADDTPTRIVADAAGRTVVVRHPRSDPPYPLVLLISASSGCAHAVELREIPHEPYLLACFDDVADGEYILLLQGP